MARRPKKRKGGGGRPNRRRENRIRGGSPLIPRTDFFGPPGMRECHISPDGTRISFIAPTQGIENVCVGPVDNPAASLSVTSVEDMNRVHHHYWTYNPRYLLYTTSFMGDENWKIYVADIFGKDNATKTNTRLLTPEEGVEAGLQLRTPLRPDEILVRLNDRDPIYHDIYRVNFVTGEKELHELNDIGAIDYFFDNDFNTRFARTLNPDGSIAVIAPDGSGGWDKVMEIPAEDAMTTYFLNFDITGRYAYLRDSRNRNTAALAELDTETGKTRILASDPLSDMADYSFHPRTGEPQAVAFERERFRWEAVGGELRRDFRAMTSFQSEYPRIRSRSSDDATWVLEYFYSDRPNLYYLYDREKYSMRLIAPSEAHLLELDLAPMRSATIKSRDGLSMVVYYTLPRGVRGKAPRKPLPTVLNVHGGPWARDSWGFDYFHQMLANRGYAVISVNYRGSTGFGKEFINAGDMEWGGKMHEDLLDTVDWAVESGIADRDRVAIMGASYGGYAALVGLTFTPDVFACGIDMFGPSELISFLESAPAPWAASDDMFKNRMGDYNTEEGREFLRSRSPLHKVGNISKPLLVAQGGNDPRVDRSQCDRLVDAMKEQGIPVIYLLFPTMGHAVSGEPALMAVIEDFLKQHLGGEAEPIAEDTFKNSSMRILDGVELINGAEAAVKEQKRYTNEQIAKLKEEGAEMRLLPERVRSGRL